MKSQTPSKTVDLFCLYILVDKNNYFYNFFRLHLSFRNIMYINVLIKFNTKQINLFLLFKYYIIFMHTTTLITTYYNLITSYLN